jgi:hypothetical protein
LMVRGLSFELLDGLVHAGLAAANRDASSVDKTEVCICGSPTRAASRNEKTRAEAQRQVKGLPKEMHPGGHIAFAGFPPLGALYDFDFAMGIFRSQKAPREAEAVMLARHHLAVDANLSVAGFGGGVERSADAAVWPA